MMALALSPADGGSRQENHALWQQIAIFVFGVLLIIVLLALPFIYPCPSRYQSQVTRIVLPLAAAAAATLLTGFISVEIPKVVKAGGAFAVFVLIFFWDPAGVLSESECSRRETQVDIYRVADWRESRCGENGEKIDKLTILDDYHVLPAGGMPLHYLATAYVYPGQSVEVYDRNVDDSHPAPPDPVDADNHKLIHWNLVIQNGIARGRYVWTNADLTDREGLFFVSSLMLNDIGARYQLPPGKTADIRAFNPPAVREHCAKTGIDSVKCTGLGTREPLIVNWDWDMWSDCKK
jgi:hypothetical protein